ncbi:MAG: hypothetical protein V1706_10095 [Pseudomonadota bacterium]
MSGKMRKVIVHCHMFKNAGSTFDWSLQRNFGDSFLDHRDNESMIQGRAQYLEEFLDANPELKAISSHHVQFPLPASRDDLQILPAIFIRHPIDRVGSVYSFEKIQQVDTPGAINAKKMSFPEYVMWRMEPTVGATIRNFQSLVLLGRALTPNMKIDESDFAGVKEVLRECSLLGLVERYDESMVLFEEQLRTIYPEIDLAYVKQNVTPGRRLSLEDRVDEVCAKLGKEATDRLLEKNESDIALYNEGKRIVENRIGATENFAEKLADFEERCQLFLVSHK